MNREKTTHPRLKDYHEERFVFPIGITLFVVILLGVLLGLWGRWDDQAVMMQADLAEYEFVEQSVSVDLQSIQSMRQHDASTIEDIHAAMRGQPVTLVIPDVVIVEKSATGASPSPLTVEVDGIFWNQENPLVTLGGETFRVGDLVQEYEIVRIGKTAVFFRDRDGNTVEKDIYENLLKPGK